MWSFVVYCVLFMFDYWFCFVGCCCRLCYLSALAGCCLLLYAYCDICSLLYLLMFVAACWLVLFGHCLMFVVRRYIYRGGSVHGLVCVGVLCVGVR